MKEEIKNMLRDLERMADGESWYFSREDAKGNYVTPPPPPPEAQYLFRRALVDLQEALRLLEKQS